MASRKKWNKDSMREAVDAVKNKEMGLLKASKTYHVPRSTLKDYVKNEARDAEMRINVPLGRKPVLPPDVENQLVEYCLVMEQSYYGLTIKDLKRMAFQLAVRNNLKHLFATEKQTAGRKWLRLFFKRHDNLSVRKPQPLSIARIRGFTPENVGTFFSLLKTELERIKYSAARLFNVDETGITTVQHRSTKIISLKGKQQVHKVSSAERGALVTVVVSMSAAGTYVPPMMVFPRRMKPELLDGAPPGTIAACHPSGWIQTELFTQWFQHFVSFVKPSKEDPVVLILDGHQSHTRNIDVIDSAREHGVSILCLPPHSTDHMQPLDVAFMKPFKTFYSQGIENWLSSHPGRVVTAFQISQLFGDAYIRAATMQNAMSGFQATGILPFNPNIFGESDFLPTPASVEDQVSLRPTAVSPTDIVPVLRIIDAEASTSGGRRGSAVVVTGTPHKTKLKESLEQKNLVCTKRKLAFEKNKKVPPQKKTSNKKPKQQSSFDSSDEDDDDLPYASTDDSDSTDNEDATCPQCDGLFSMDKHGEQWIQCTKCFNWGHEKCDTRKTKAVKYICIACIAER